MKLSSLIGHSKELANAVIQSKRLPADALISSFFKKRRYLGSRDRREISRILYHFLRQFFRFDYLLGGAFWSARNTLTIERHLVMTLHELEIRDSEAIVVGLDIDESFYHQTVEVLTSEAVAIELLSEDELIALKYSFPLWFIRRMKRDFPQEDLDDLLQALQEEAPITIRVNELKDDREDLIDTLRDEGIIASAGRYSQTAIHLEKRIPINSLASYNNGWFEMQDEGSQLLSELLRPQPGWEVFDACAGGGGKSLHIAALMKDQGNIIAHDTDKRRLNNLVRRKMRSGADSIRLLYRDDYLREKEDLRNTFDLVFIDAPCSGSGTIRRSPDLLLRFTTKGLDEVLELQYSILEEYSSLVKAGGTLAYATCSILRDENERQVTRFLKEHSGWRLEPIIHEKIDATSEGYVRLYPHVHGTDGFFLATLKKVL